MSQYQITLWKHVNEAAWRLIWRHGPVEQNAAEDAVSLIALYGHHTWTDEGPAAIPVGTITVRVLDFSHSQGAVTGHVFAHLVTLLHKTGEQCSKNMRSKWRTCWMIALDERDFGKHDSRVKRPCCDPVVSSTPAFHHCICQSYIYMCIVYFFKQRRLCGTTQGRLLQKALMTNTTDFRLQRHRSYWCWSNIICSSFIRSLYRNF